MGGKHELQPYRDSATRTVVPSGGLGWRGVHRMKRSRLKPMSAKRRRENAARKKLIARMTRGGPPRCAMCNALADDPHEVLPRARGGSITDESNIRFLCRPCHSWITHTAEGQQWAHLNGYLKHSWERTA